MKVPDEFLEKVLRREVDMVIVPAPPGKRIASRICRTTRITRDSRLPGGKKYGIVNVFGATYKKIKDLKEEEVRRAGHESLKAFRAWWASRQPEYTPNDRIALMEFELVAVERIGLRFLEGNEILKEKR
jgi:hypothetical protein